MLDVLSSLINQSSEPTMKLDLSKLPTEIYFRNFGTSNPELYNNPFYDYMIRQQLSPYKFKEVHEIVYDELCPIFTFSPRIGMTQTRIPSLGLTVYIGGEYDDFYDPDFIIYNDVIAIWDDEAIKHYGYPEAIFPGTDFHSSTYYPPHNAIYIIGRCGSDGPKNDEFKATEVFSLNLSNFEIKKIDVKGISLGWINNHKAELYDDKIFIKYRKNYFDENAEFKTVWLNLNDFSWDSVNM